MGNGKRYEVPYGQNPYNAIGKYIRDNIEVIEDIIAVIELNGVETNELFMVDFDDDSLFVWKSDWWEGEEKVVLLDFFPVSEATHLSAEPELATDTISRQGAINALWKALFEYEDKTEKQFLESDELDVADWIQHRNFVQNMSDIDRQTILNLPSVQPEAKWHDCDPTDKNTLPEPGSWAIWCDKEGHRIIARWKEDAIDHFWPDQRMFDFNLEDAVAWTEIPKM